MDLFKRTFCIVFLIIFLGCSNIKIIDKVEDGTPKGFVKFTVEDNPKGSLPTKIRIQDGNHTEYIGPQNVLKFAKPTGNHFFYAVLGTKMEGITVSIIEGMLTPVKIFFVKTGLYGRTEKSYDKLIFHNTMSFRLNVVVDNPVPVQSED